MVPPRGAQASTRPGSPRSLRSDAATQLDRATDLAPGTQLRQGKSFEIVEQVGEGGMGKIYRAFEPLMDRYVALKVLKLDVPEHQRLRFRREAVIAAGFSHENLPRVLDVGAMPEYGLAWMTMEYLRGLDLGRVVERGRGVPPALLVDLFDQTLAALEYIHQRSIVHCDVKPDNIFVTRDPFDRTIVIVKLLDFGICQRIGEPVPVLDHFVGDPRYMPPEQARAGAAVDARADLYALGISMYEVLAGRHPFAEYLEAPTRELLRVHREHCPQLPSTHLPPHAPAGFAEALDAVIEAAIAKRPDERFQSAKAMRTALGHVRDALAEDEALRVAV